MSFGQLFALTLLLEDYADKIALNTVMYNRAMAGFERNIDKLLNNH